MIVFRWVLKMFFRIFLFLLLLVVIVFIAFNWPVGGSNEDMEFGISYAHIQARALELDWKKVYIDILEELRPKSVRIGAYWTEIEKEPGKYDFSDLDWLIEEARRRDTEIILAFGIKAPRWPECFIPEFYLEDKVVREEAILKYEKELVERYKSYENIIIWQVENEPFLPFGHCIEGAVDEQLVDREVAQVKKLDDSRPIMVTDSGELSLWHKAASRSDIFGTTLYRIIYKEPYGYVKYPVGPAFFRIKAWLFVHGMSNKNQKEIIVSELQAEPWGPGWLPHMSLEEQYKSMNPTMFGEIITYTKRTNFSAAYLWGVEWWYWLKETQGEDAMWEEARKVITQRD